MPIATTQLNTGMEAPFEPRSLLDANIRGQQLGALQRSNADTDRANREQMTLADVMRTSQTRDGQFDPQAFATRVVADPSLSAAAKAKAIDYSAPMIRQNAIKGILAKHTGPEGTLHIPSAMNELMAVDPEYFQKVNENLNNGLPEYIKKKESIVTDAANAVANSENPLATYDAHRMMASALLSPEEHAKFFPPLSEQEEAANWQKRFSSSVPTKQESAAELQAQKDAAAMERLRLQEAGDTERARIAAANRTPHTPKTAQDGKPLSDTGAKTLGLLAGGLDGTGRMIEMLKKNDVSIWDSSLLGGFTNPEARNAILMATEAIGRMNSGGAITTDEEKRFSRMVADKTMLSTAKGRAELLRSLEGIQKRAKATGKVIYGGDGWQSEFGVSDDEAVDPPDADGWTTIDGVRIREIQ